MKIRDLLDRLDEIDGAGNLAKMYPTPDKNHKTSKPEIVSEEDDEDLEEEEDK